MKKISIIVATYNAALSIEATLQSILNQTYKNYEVVLIDGASSDETLGIADGFRDKIKELIVLSEKDKGVYDAMNKGVKMAVGDYVYFLNAGDVFIQTTTLQSVVPFLDGKSIVYGDAYTKDRFGSIVPYRTGIFNKYRIGYTNICHQSIFYPIELLREEPYNLNYKVFADWALNMRFFKKVDFKHIEVPVVNYEGGGISDTQKDIAFVKDLKINIFKNLGVLVLINNAIRKVLRILGFKLNY